MTKKQKVWLGVSLAMFVVPEILWGAIIKILNLSFVPIYKDPQFFYDYPFFALALIVVELVGVGGLIYVVNKISLRKFYKYFINIFLGILFVLLVIGLVLSYISSHISFP